MKRLRAAANFFLDIIVEFLPGGRNVRVAVHRMRGVHVSGQVFISRRVILETKYPEKIRIGTNVSIGIGTTVLAHHDTSEDMTGVDVVIGDNVYIGPHCVLLPGSSVGENSVVAAGSVVNKPIKPNVLVRGNPCVAVAEVTTPLGLDGDMTAFLRGLRHFKGK
jgi:acetyltransferase-like isoleucine patch superfamily enzyme